MIATLEQLDEATLYQILTVPKNAIVKQYQKMVELDGVALRFEEDALLEIARKQLNGRQVPRGRVRLSRTSCWISCMNFLHLMK